MGTSARRSNADVKILIAEDSATQAQNLRHLLEKHGYQVRVAGNGRLALDLVRQSKPTLVISDVVMPVMDGYELCKAIKSDEKLKDIPVILVTTLSDAQDVILGLECGANNFVRKPYDERQLLSRIDYLLMNMELRKMQRMRSGVEISLGGRTHFITSDRQQILDLLISTYEQAVQVNGELATALAETERVNRDLHERELEANAANQAKSMFLAAMSHEIRTPLIGVLGMLEVLGHSRLDTEQRQQFDIVQQSARSLLEIIGDILDYSKIEAGKVELAVEALSVRDLVSRVVSMFSANARSRNLQLVQEVAAAVAAAHVGDPVRIRQVLANLVSNAVKFTERGGTVTVTVRVLEQKGGTQQLVFSVSDTGIGMTPAQVSRLFQPFVQADVGTTRRFGGTGLGLVISRRLSEIMGGTLRVDSVLDQGTVMTLEVRLPIGSPQEIAAATEEEVRPINTRPRPTREQAQREGSLLLLAEDHAVNRKVLTRQFELSGFVVDSAEDGTRAFEKFSAGNYGLVFTDLHMPGLDGLQLTAAIREFEQTQGRGRTPIIALTADVLRADIEHCLTSGMDDYLSKPVTIRQLTEKLQRWLPGLEWGPPPTETSPPESALQRRSKTPVDQTVLYESTDSDVGKARELLREYCEVATGDLKSLSEARGDAATADAAHRIKGAALMVGAHEVADIAERIELAARQSQTAGVAALIEDLRQAVSRVREYVPGVTGEPS